MPRISSTGHVVMGVGAGPVSVDGLALPNRTGGCLQWLDGDDTIIGNLLIDGVFRVAAITWRTGEIHPVSDQGANELAAGGHRWAGWNAAGVFGPSGSDAAAGLSKTDGDGRAAAGEDGTIAIIPNRGQGMPTLLARPDATIAASLQGVVRDLRILPFERALWRDDARKLYGHGLTVPVLPWPAEQAWWVDLPGESPWLAYWSSTLGVVAHPVDSFIGVQIVPLSEAAYYLAVRRLESGAIKAAWSAGQGEHPGDLRTCEDIRALPRVDLLTLAQPIGPIGPSRGEDGRLYDLRPFVVGAPNVFPRSGPTHAVNQTSLHDGGIFEVVKFGTLAPLGAHYEMWGLDANWFHLLEDASDTTSNRWSDTRHFPIRMSIGLSHQFVSGPHSFTSKARGTCQPIETRHLGRSVWILGLWDRFSCGPDLGERAVVCLVFDPTEGVYNDQRMIELGYFAYGAGWFRWEAHRSDLVYASGTPVFNDMTRTARSDFYLLGGPNVQPALTGCVAPVIPEDPMLKKPEVTVEQWTLQHLRDGEVLQVYDRENPDAAYRTRVWIENGGLKVQITNAAGEGHTGAFRKVYPS